MKVNLSTPLKWPANTHLFSCQTVFSIDFIFCKKIIMQLGLHGFKKKNSINGLIELLEIACSTQAFCLDTFECYFSPYCIY